MKSETITLHRIKQKLLQVPLDKLDEIHNFIEFVMMKSSTEIPRRIEKMEGTWKGIGFEKIDDLEDQIREIREMTEISLAVRSQKWNI